MATGSQRQALALVGLSRSTWHYRHRPRPRVLDPLPAKDRAYRNRIGRTDRAEIARLIRAGWAASNSVDQSFATAWDQGIMLASRRTWWRIAAAMDQAARPLAPTRRRGRGPATAPVLRADGPGQVWSWDITELRSPWAGRTHLAYSIIDLYSRMIVGWRVEEREIDRLAVEMFQQAFATHGHPQVVHADSGAAMRSGALSDLFSARGIKRSHNRPRVSNDNPFSEAEFRTMKYRPGYPGTFPDVATARAWVSDYVPWYNEHHCHSGIAHFTPASVHSGSWKTQWAQRDSTLQAYHDAHPERFRHRPRTATPAPTVGINLPTG